MRDTVVLINLDGVACRSLTRKLRAEQFYCRILPAGASADQIAGRHARGIVLAGGSTGEAAEIPNVQEVLNTGLPVLAMGDAALSLCEELGGSINMPEDENQHLVQVYFTRDPLVEGVENGERHFHALRTLTLAESMSTMADSSIGVLGFRIPERSIYGLTFQVEQNDTDGMRLLTNFCRDVCGCDAWWSEESFIERSCEEITARVGDAEAVCAISGGVDSGVCAMLGHKAIGHKLHCIFIDNGLLRKDEGDLVEAFYREQAGMNFLRINAGERFIGALKGVTSQREKEQIIFNTLHEVLSEAIGRFPEVRMMFSGTNYSDTIDRNGEDEPDSLHGLKLVAPLRELFKDEIRHVGEQFDLPSSIVHRQPFPGSGLALRILGEVTQEKLDIVREADDIFRSAIEESGQSKRLWQYFATMADNPAREADEPESYVVTLRAVQAIDGAAAMPARLPNDLLERISADILAAVPAVVRVLYDLTPSHNYAQVEWR